MYERYDIPNCSTRSGVELQYIAYYSNTKRWTGTRYAHDFWELYICLKNTCDFYVQEEYFPLHPGDFVVVNPDVVHVESGRGHQWIVLGIKNARHSFCDSAKGYIKGNCGHNTDIITRLSLSLYHEAKNKPESYIEACSSLFELVLLYIRRIVQGSHYTTPISVGITPQSTKYHSITWAKQYIESNFKDAITLDELSSKIGLNKYSLIRDFKAAYGVSPMAYLLECRFDEAKCLLSSTDHSIGFIAQSVGFSRSNYFSQQFSKREGVSPSKFRLLQKSKS